MKAVNRAWPTRHHSRDPHSQPRGIPQAPTSCAATIPAPHHALPDAVARQVLADLDASFSIDCRALGLKQFVKEALKQL